MLGTSSHAFKVNFCKFTNATRCAIEDDSRHSGRRYIAALNGTASGGGYELAIACDEIYLVDDGNAAVALPEVPLLGVLPGTGGLTRLVDKRKVRRDRADLFATLAEGLKSHRAKEWGLIDGYFPPSKFQAAIAARAQELIAANPEPKTGTGIKLNPLQVEVSAAGREYAYINLRLDREKRYADLTLRLLELALGADRTYMLNDPRRPIVVALSPMNGGTLPMSNGLTRLESRFPGDRERVARILKAEMMGLDTEAANEAGLITSAPDSLD